MLLRLLLLAGLMIPTWAILSPAQTGTPALKVRHIHIWVKDVERTKAFYRDKLGLKVSSERPGQNVEFLGGQLWFGKWRGSGTLPTEAITIGIEADSVDAAYRMVKQRGVTVAEPPKQQPYGWSFQLKDPDGYEIEIEGNK